MVLGFKPQFVPKILDGTKIHTLRKDATQRWKPGRSIQFATGVRTKNYKTFREDGECKCVQTIWISHEQKRALRLLQIKMVGQLCPEIYQLNCLLKMMASKA